MIKNDLRKVFSGRNHEVTSEFSTQERPLSTREAMEAELRNIERLTIRIMITIALVILAYAGALACTDIPCIFNSPAAPTVQVNVMTAASVATAKADALEAGDTLRPGFLSTVALYGAVHICAMVSGAFLGFLFGIPRQSLKVTPTGVAASATSENENRTGSFAGNTNLEEISDWLTKIIVGLGLTQASNLYFAFVNAKTEFASLSMQNTPGADSMFTAVLLSGLALGFLFLYMETRTRVALLLVTSDHVQNSFSADRLLSVLTQKTDSARALNSVRVTSLRPLSQQASPSKEDWEIASLPMEVPRGTDELITWVLAQLATRNLAQAEKALTKAIERSPNRPEFYTSLAAVRSWAGNPRRANQILDDAAERFPQNPRVWKDKLLVSLYLSPPNSYQNALAAAEALKAIDATASNDPFVWLWISCAYGQKFSFVNSDEEKKEARAFALEAVRAVIANSPPGGLVRAQLRKVYDPAIENSDPLENDLEVFHNDPEFAAEMAKAV